MWVKDALIPKVATNTTIIPNTTTPLTDVYLMEDTSSFLESLRAYQLQDILGKYKLF